MINSTICTIGGGTGMPVINEALLKAGYKHVDSVVTTFDSGGDTGRMRTDERGRILAFSDYWRSLISLWADGKQKADWVEMLRFRDGRGRNFGNIFFQFMSEKAGNLSDVDNLFSHLTGAKINGSVVPVSLVPTDVCFETISGAKYCGEHHLDNLRMSFDKVSKVWLTPEVPANEDALQALERAKVIILCPGSMYGSLITTILPKGVSEAYKKSKAKKILMTNLMSVANENDGYTQDDYVKIFARYLGDKKPVDQVIMADINELKGKSFEKTMQNYEMEHSYPIRLSEKQSYDYETSVMDVATIDKSNFRLRHSVSKLAKVFATMNLCRKEN